MGLLGEMTVELLGLAAARRAEPRDDVVSMLASYEEDGETLTDDELGMFLIQLLVAGNETTRNSISGALVALAAAPRSARPPAPTTRRCCPRAVEEVLRWTTPVTSFLRTAVADTALGDGADRRRRPAAAALRVGQPRRSRVRPDRRHASTSAASPNHHVALGHGPHFCLGAALARLELTVVLEGVAERWSRLEEAGPVVRSGSSIIAGIRSAPLRLAAR